MIHIVTNLNHDQDPEHNFFLSAFLFSVIYLAKLWLETYYFHSHIEVTLSAAHAIRGLVYKKINCISLASLQDLNLGKVINLLANDINDIPKGGLFLWSMTTSPFSILMVSYFMWEHFGWFTIIAMTVLISLMQVANYLSQRSKGIRSQKNMATDNRIKMTNQVIEAIRLIKFYGWEQPMSRLVEEFRSKETKLNEDLNSYVNMNLTMVDLTVYLSMLLICIGSVATG